VLAQRKVQQRGEQAVNVEVAERNVAALRDENPAERNVAAVNVENLLERNVAALRDVEDDDKLPKFFFFI
jgi:hypothetical protein